MTPSRRVAGPHTTVTGAPVAAQIQSVARAARLLLFAAEHPDGYTAKQAAIAHDMALPTTYHLLTTLVAEGLLVKDSRRYYSLGPKIGALSDAFLRQVRAPEYLLAPLRQLATTTGETTYLTAWRGEEIRVLASVEGANAVRVAPVHSGYFASGHARASGKLLLAFAWPELREAYLSANPLLALTPRTITTTEALTRELESIRKRGYAYDEEEFIEGVCCVAAPVVENGVAVAAYTVSAPSSRFRARRAALTDAVLFTARSASSTAGREAAPPHPAARTASRA